MHFVRAIRRFVFLSGCAAVAVFVSHVQAATRYFDVNGTAPGSGITAGGSYSWEDPVWNNNDPTGTSAPTTWTDGDFARFAAGTDAAGLTYTVTASSDHAVNGMQVIISTTLPANGGANTNVNTSGSALLKVGAGPQGFFASTNTNLRINGNLGQFDSTTRMLWQGGGGSLYLYGDNSNLTNGVILNAANGLNFNNDKSFGPASAPLAFLDGTLAASLGLGAPTVTTYVLANPDTTAPVTIPNSVTMRSDANTTLIYTGHDAVTFSGTWTLGSTAGGRNNALQIGNTPFPAAKMIISNGIAGDTSSNLTVQSAGGVSGVLVVPAASTYGGITTLGQLTGNQTTAAAPSTGTPALQATDGVGLPTNSLLQLNGGVLQTNGTFNRPLGASFGHFVAWGWPTGQTPGNQTAPGGGGFSAIDSPLTVNINGDGSELAWGESTGDIGSRILGPLKFGSATSNAKTSWVNPIDLAGLGTAGVSRTITVTKGIGGDSAEMSGIIRNTGVDIDLTKNGTGTLSLSAANTYGGTTTVSAGTLLASNTSGSATGTSAITIAASGTLGGTGTVSGAITNNGTIAPGVSVGTLFAKGGVTDGANSSWSIELSGASADKLAVTGNIDLSAADSLNVTGTGTGSSWIIGTYTGSLTGTFDTVTPGYTVSYTGGNITLNAAVGLAGDFNNDGKVDAGDYGIWRKNDLANAALPNDNGLTTQAARFSLWRANFGHGSPGSGSGLGTNDGAVPEPTSIALLLLGFAALANGRRGRLRYSIEKI